MIKRINVNSCLHLCLFGYLFLFMKRRVVISKRKSMKGKGLGSYIITHW